MEKFGSESFRIALRDGVCTDLLHGNFLVVDFCQTGRKVGRGGNVCYMRTQARNRVIFALSWNIDMFEESSSPSVLSMTVNFQSGRLLCSSE